MRAESSGAGHGATFTVELPRIDPLATETSAERRGDGDAVDPSEAPEQIELAGYRILVVDDQQDARDLLAAILTASGARAETASSVQDALQRLDLDRPDALLADIGMPGADGYRLIREVRRRDAQSGRHLPVAAITAYAGDQDRERVMAAGFDRHVPKPITRSEIVDAVIAICRGQD